MAHAETAVVVPRPVPVVYAFLADPGNLRSWIPAIQRLTLVSGPAGRVGAEYAATVAAGGATREGRITIVRLDPPSGMEVRITAAPLRVDGRVTVEELGDGARLTVALHAPTRGLLRLMDGPIEQALRDSLDGLPLIADALPRE